MVAAMLELMTSFSARTGLTQGTEPAGSRSAVRGCLWTDAFAVCNFLELHRRTGAEEHLRSALALVDQVHWTLGRHRADDSRTGWISGLEEEEGRAHPTRGGLRIGKQQGERAPGEPFDEGREWDRDGQYFHYLTRWMHALACVGRVSGEARYVAWAVELARAAHAGFTHPTPGGGRSLYWKMSIDLSRPLVPSTGQHDPLDGLLTLMELQAASTGAHVLREEIAELRSMCAGAEWATADPLGLGGLLCDAYRLAQLLAAGHSGSTELLADILRSSARGLTALARQGGLAGPASQRLAFRELGLSIGLQALARLEALRERAPTRLARSAPTEPYFTELRRLAPEGERIRDFWLDPANRATSTWSDHLDINAVMLATALAPDGFLSG